MGVERTTSLPTISLATFTEGGTLLFKEALKVAIKYQSIAYLFYANNPRRRANIERFVGSKMTQLFPKRHNAYDPV